MFSSNTSQVSSAANYIEDVFSTYLYTGDDSTSRLIQNNIDLSTKGGLVWLKRRDGAQNHALYDTARGATYRLISNLTNAQDVVSGVSAFNTNGFTMGADLNYLGQTMASWTFRKQPKFFDVVTWTGTGSATTIAHNLGSAPGCILVKKTSGAENWAVYHRSTTSSTYYLVLNSTAAEASSASVWNSTDPTSTVFSVGNSSLTNQNGQTYVAYLFAHDAGGFGLTGTDNVISCGSFTTDGSGNATVNLGYEPQWAMFKCTTTAQAWFISDSMRGMPVGSADAYLVPNTSAAESTYEYVSPTATGFTISNQNTATYIYIAIRRGPMKVPTSGTSVYNAKTITGTNVTNPLTGVGFAPDLLIASHRNTNALTHPTYWDKLRGRTQYITSSSTASEGNTLQSIVSFDMDGITLGEDGLDLVNKASGTTYVHWLFKRAPSFFDEVCYTGTGSATTINHNLGVAPELMIVKIRNQPGAAWAVYNAASGNTKVIRLNTTAAETTSSAYWNNTSPTSSVFTVGNDGDVNNSSDTYVAYLFASAPGVSKVGSYTGTGTTKQIDCGFTGGARFVLIKRTDSTGDWYVWDSARGIVAGNDPYLLLNSTAAEVTSTDYIDTYSAGFEISSTAPAAINANGGTFIYLAIA